MYYECKFNAFSLFYVRLAIKYSFYKAFLTIQGILGNIQRIRDDTNNTSRPKKFTAISFRTSAQENRFCVEFFVLCR